MMSCLGKQLLIILLGVIFITHETVNAQSLSSDYVLDQGLQFHEPVYHIAETNLGRLVLSTPFGVRLYDGHHMASFTVNEGLLQNDVYATQVDEDDRVWINSFNTTLEYIDEQGLHHIDLSMFDNDVIQFPLLEYEEHVVVNRNLLFDKSAERIVLKQSPAERFDYNCGPTKSSVADNEYSICLDGHLKLYDREGLIGEWMLANRNLGFIYTRLSNDISCFFNKRYMLFVRDGVVPRLYELDSLLTEKNSWYPTISSMEDSKVQFYCGNHWYALDSAFNIDEHLVHSLHQDGIRTFRSYDGSYWLYHYNTGAQRYAKESGIYSKSLPYSSTTMIKDGQELLIFGVGQDVSVFNVEDRSLNFIPGFGRYDRRIIPYVALRNDKSIHVFCNNGVYEVDRTAESVDSSNRYLISNGWYNVKDVCIDGEVIYAVKSKSLIIQHLDGNLMKYEHDQGRLRCVGVSKGEVYVGDAYGLYKLQNSSIKRVKDCIVADMLQYDSLIFVVTERGEVFSIDGGLVDSLIDIGCTIYSLDVNEHWMCLSTEEHLYIYGLGVDRKVQLEFVLDRGYNLDNLPARDLIIDDSVVYVLGSHSVSVVDIADVKLRQPPKPYIIHWNGGEDRRLSLELGSVFWGDQEYLQYAYRLFPLKKEWQYLSSNDLVIENLKHGNYTLEVRVVDLNGQDGYFSKKFRIAPFWWERPWLQIGCIVIGLVLVGLVIINPADNN